MRYVVVGAGAIGGTVGGCLSEAGHPVVFVARGAHGAAIAADGLTLASPQRRVTLRIPVFPTLADAELAADDIVVMAVKSQDAVAVLDDLARAAPDDIPASRQLSIFCFQNGIHSEREASRRFANVHGVSVRLPSTYLSPGVVTAHSAPLTGVFEIGRSTGGVDAIDEQFVDALSASTFAARAHEDVMAWKRRKLLVNLRNALEVLCEPAAEGRADVASAMIDEGLACYAAAGESVVSVEEWSLPPADQLTHSPGNSTWQSVARGLTSVESDYLNGEIALLGRLHGVPTPVNVAVQDAMRRVVAGRLEPGATTPMDLLAGRARSR